MPARYDTDDELDDSRHGNDREISLGTGTVLAIFLALALVCSLFFGLGYSMGRRSAPGVAAAPTSAMSGMEGGKPLPPGSASRSVASGSGGTQADGLQVVQPMDGSAAGSDSGPVGEAAGGQAASARVPSHVRPSASVPSGASEEVAPAVAADAAANAATAMGPQSYVQVAAVSRKEDADLLLAALKRRGYAGVIRPQTQDKLLHVQVGPFPTKKDAEAMRQHLITDGYNPILK